MEIFKARSELASGHRVVDGLPLLDKAVRSFVRSRVREEKEAAASELGVRWE